jgi:HCOMODA/2-hydroxy-3-carboxy-muconic semialdehyde decarboxylase
MSQQMIADLVTANHILAHFGVLDSFGHVSVRCRDRSDLFMMSRSIAPATVQAGDVLVLDMDGEPVDDTRRPYLERFIHSEIYKARADVMAIVHSHSPSVIPFGVVASQPLRPIYHMAAGAGCTVPLFDIADACDEPTDMLIRDPKLGKALACTLGANATVLMRGHGVTVAAPTLKAAVFNAYYLEWNARLQTQAMLMGDVKYLSEGEIEAAAATNYAVMERAWDSWREMLAV